VLDIQSAVTHEFGHVCGLKDISGISNTEQTMYGATAAGETKKRTLESGDIAGLGMKLMGYGLYINSTRYPGITKTAANYD
jgi:hypothetical protein